MVTDPTGVLLQLARILDDLGVRYAVGGSVASSRHGEIRATQDIDVLVELDLRTARALGAALGDDYHLDPATVEVALSAGGTFSAVHLRELMKVDFFVATDEKLHRLQLEHREPVSLVTAGPDVYFASAEDTILAKLVWFVKSDRVLERQVRDVVGILKVKGSQLDLDYLAHPASVLGVGDLLVGALDDAGMGGPVWRACHGAATAVGDRAQPRAHQERTRSRLHTDPGSQRIDAW